LEWNLQDRRPGYVRSTSYAIIIIIIIIIIIKVKQPRWGLEWPGWFQEVKVPRFHDNGTGWW
jgi:hypothetical protein